jgi:heme o synthase
MMLTVVMRHVPLGAPVPRVAFAAKCVPHQTSRATIARVLSTQSDVEATALATAVKAVAIDGEAALPLKERVAIYSQLSKLRLSSLVVMTTGAGFLMAGGPISWGSFAAATVGTSLAAASANTFNQAWEAELDSKMNRTSKRPLPSGKISRGHAVAFGASTAAVSTAILAAGCSPLVASLGLFNIGLYSLVYTPMKMRSELNTWVGALVGAVPPVMGWAAATGTVVAPEAILMGSLLFLWQMPHFFSLSYRLRSDYMRGGYQMVACNDPTGARSAKLALRYSLYMSALPFAAAMTDVTSYMYVVEGSVVNAYATYLAYQFYKKPTSSSAQKVFLCSLWYLPVMMGAMVLHNQQWLTDEEKEEKNKAKHGWREAFLGEVENFQPLEPAVVQHGDESTLSAYVVDKVRTLRHCLKEMCLHENLWGVKDSKRNADESSILCPVHVGTTAKETAAIAAHATRKDV